MTYDLGQRVTCNHLDRYNNDYKTNPTACPKCLGSNYYYDLLWSEVDGNIIQVINLPLLQELCLKAVLTELGNSTFHPEYGTSIYSSVANATSSFESVKRIIEREVGVALAGLKGRQDLQIALTQTLTDDERIYELNQIEVKFIDERTLNVNLYITTESGKDLVFAV